MNFVFLFTFFLFLAKCSATSLYYFYNNKIQHVLKISFLESHLFCCFQVVHNKNITKTQKVRFFTGQVLNHIASLYSWKGIVDVSLDSVEVQSLGFAWHHC